MIHADGTTCSADGGKQLLDHRRDFAVQPKSPRQSRGEVVRTGACSDESRVQPLYGQSRPRAMSTFRVGYPRPRQDEPRRPGPPTPRTFVGATGTRRLGAARNFDGNHPQPAERLPRQLDVHIAPVPVDLAGDTVPKILPVWNGRPCGDMLSDNAYEDDGYRYHDAFHLAYLAVLGWSPVMRALLRRKRKAVSRIDQVEDGGRAIAIEEAISVVVFEAASRSNYFKAARHIDPATTDICRRLTSHLEVFVCTAREWERAILDGYAAWRILREQGSGAILCDLDTRSISARPLTSRELKAHTDVCAAIARRSATAPRRS